MMQATDKTPTEDLANEIERLIASEPDSEFDLAEVIEMVPGMTETGARAALAWLMAANRAEEHGGYYRLTDPNDHVRDIDPTEIAKAQRALVEALHAKAQTLLRELAAHLDDRGCSAVVLATSEIDDAVRGHLAGLGWTAEGQAADLASRA
jgi:hypothetical protein